jgi:hypothetical protein
LYNRLASLDLRRQKLVDQSLNLIRRTAEMKIATTEWKSNLSSLSIDESGLTLDSSNQLRERVAKISQDVKKFENDMKSFVNQVYKLQDVSKNFDRDLKSLQLSVDDASRVNTFSSVFLIIYKMNSFRKHESYSPKLIKLNIKHNVQLKNRT